MIPVNVVVVFYSRYGETEKLALAAGVGAVQARASIRLRRLQDLANAQAIERDPRWQESLERMTQDYIAPREIDAEWADVILVASCPDSPAETDRYRESLSALPGKLIVPITNQAPDRIAAARAQGKQAAEKARELKS